MENESEIITEMKEFEKEMDKLIEKQTFKVEDAVRYRKRFFNYRRKIEQLFESRGNWRDKYLKLKELKNA